MLKRLALKFCTLILLLSAPAYAAISLDQSLLNNQFSLNEVQAFFEQNPEYSDVFVVRSKLLLPTEENENVIGLKVYIENSTDILIIRKSETGLEAEPSDVKYLSDIKTVDGVIEDTVYESVLLNLNDESVAHKVDESVSEEFSTTKGLKVQASYSFDVETFLEDGVIVEYGDVLYVKVTVGKAIVEKVLVEDSEESVDHPSIITLKTLIPDDSERIFETPVNTKRVTSLFNLARRHPVKKRRIQPHNGIDFAAKSGTPVFAALEGKIITMGRARAKGKFIVIEHENGFQTTYDHLKKFRKGLKVGSRVTPVNQIGEVGRTGYATGPHLHFGLLKNDQYVNPLHYLKDYQIEEGQFLEEAE